MLLKLTRDASTLDFQVRSGLYKADKVYTETVIIILNSHQMSKLD